NQPNTDSYLEGLSALSPQNIWAVGHFHIAPNGAFSALAEHWDGSQWRIVPGDNYDGVMNFLYAVDALSAKDVWAVGYSGNPGTYHTLTEHWDGIQWSIVPSPNVGTGNNNLNALSAISPGDI